MRRTYIPCAIFAALALAAPPPPLAGAGNESVPPPTLVPQQPVSPEELFNRALEYRDKAWKLEAEAAESPDKAEKLLKKADKEYGKAVKKLREAVEAKPDFHQAYSSLGYALRKTGELEASIEAYDRALELAPGYPEALEYRAEAYLGLGRLEEVQEAYMELFRNDRKRADELMAAMDAWLEANGDASGAEEFRAWVEERAQIAAQTAELGGEAGADW